MTKRTLPAAASPAASPAGKRPKAGRSKTVVRQRRALFVEAFLTNGHNAAAAAAAAGYTSKHLARSGWEVMQDPAIRTAIAERAREVSELAGMTTENWGAALRSIAFASIGDLYDVGGHLIPMHALPAHVKAALSGVKYKDGQISELKMWDKNQALVTMARHLGLFERDNAQQRSDINVRIELVG